MPKTKTSLGTKSGQIDPALKRERRDWSTEMRGRRLVTHSLQRRLVQWPTGDPRAVPVELTMPCQAAAVRAAAAATRNMTSNNAAGVIQPRPTKGRGQRQ